MAYQALYRAWRPKTFSEMVGQEAIVRALSNQAAGKRVAHAYLFCGSRGTGKTSAARIMAMAINCEVKPDTKAIPSEIFKTRPIVCSLISCLKSLICFLI